MVICVLKIIFDGKHGLDPDIYISAKNVLSHGNELHHKRLPTMYHLLFFSYNIFTICIFMSARAS